MKVKIFNKSMVNITLHGVKILPLTQSPVMDIDSNEVQSLSQRIDLTIMYQDPNVATVAPKKIPAKRTQGVK